MRAPAVLAALALALPAAAFETATTDHLEIKWVRDSAEYQAIARQTYRLAAASVQAQVKRRRGKTPWAVVLDVDDTTLDTSPYWLELAAYDRVFDWAGWDAWCERRVAEPVPGVVAFVATVREAGGRVAYITNRSAPTRQATIDDLTAHGLWQAGDLICTHGEPIGSVTKRDRRAQLRAGEGACAWPDKPVDVLAYIGDTVHDLPEDGEEGPSDEALGVRDFLIPNPMYGGWDSAVTREIP